MTADQFQTRSTSRQSADATPVVLRLGERIRLVFKPTLVRNARDAAAAVHGAFVYQRKAPAGEWEDVEAINLASLRSGDGVRLELSSVEVLRLWQQLGGLYQLVEREGVPMGVQEWTSMPRTQVLDAIRGLLSADESPAEQLQALEVFVRWLQEQDAERLARVLEGDLLHFDATISAAKLRRFLDEAQAQLANSVEEYWQRLLESNSWALSQIVAQPIVIVRSKVYVGGKDISNTGGSIADFLYRQKLTSNATLVEMKPPTTPLLAGHEYRPGVYGPSADLSGAVQQLLHDRHALEEEYLILARGEDEFRTFSTRALLLIGRSPATSDVPRCRSLELYRGSQRDIEILTFDDLLEKVRMLLALLSA
jgi:hypothetical protein